MGVYCDLMNEQNVNRTMIINLECVLGLCCMTRGKTLHWSAFETTPYTRQESVTLEEPRSLNQQVKVMSG